MYGLKCNISTKADKKRKSHHTANVFTGENGMKAQPKSMSIIIYLGRDIKEYESKSEEIIARAISEGRIQCELCLQPMSRHSSYERGIKETGQRITITMVWCNKCRKWHALLPDFLLPHKHYSGNEIESVIIDSASIPVKEIETEASETTARRWIRQIGGRIRRSISILKYLFGREGQAVSEAAIDAGPGYSELEQLLEMAPAAVKYSGNKLGLANLWLGTNRKNVYI